MGTSERPNNRITVEEAFSRLDSSPEGISSADAQQRLARYGPNELAEEKKNPFLIFFTYFWGPIPWMIEIAALLSALVRNWPDFIIILILLLANALVGFWEEYKAGNTIAALKKRLAIQARVRRDGAWSLIPSQELVQGDLVRLRTGDIIPADAYLLEGELEVDQSTLTGESLPVKKEVGETVYSGSIVKRGEQNALIFWTGSHTFFGRTAQLVQATHVTSHIQRAVLKIGDYLIVVAASLVTLILFVALFRGDNFITVLQFALVLVVAAVPVAMPTVLSVSMAVGAHRLSILQAIVTRLSAIEELAGVDILCADKTGTLTKNELTMGEPFCVEGARPDEVLLAAALAARSENQDPIDLAVLRGIDSQALAPFNSLAFQPFDPVSKRTEATLAENGKTFRVTKGAPQVIQSMAANGERTRSEVDQAIEKLAARGFRSLGVARSEGAEWKLLGILPLYDPPREDSRAMIEKAREMGISVKMVTGDQLPIAREIAHQVNLGTNILDAALLDESKGAVLPEEEIEKSDGFAQAFPEHKYKIVEVLQRRNHIVGMTGDGVNDAPSLKLADAGIAVSGATDAARAAADIVLILPGLSVIIEAIQESRRIFQRMNSYAIYRIAETIRVLFFMTLSILVFNFYPVTAIMIVLLALLNDGAILSIAYDKTFVSRQPERWNMPVVLGLATILGLFGVIASFLFFFLGERVLKLDRATIQTLMYLKLSVAGHLTVFLARTRGAFWTIPPARILFFAVLGTQLLATLIAVYGFLMAPIGWGLALLVWGYALIWFLLNDRVKLAAYRLFDLKQLVWFHPKQPLMED